MTEPEPKVPVEVRAWIEAAAERVTSRPAAPNNYKQIVENSHRVFTVFTGAALSFYVTELFTQAEPAWRFWVMPAAIALLLRYIVGSAIHLNNTYASAPTNRFSTDILLFFDIFWLVLFGYLAVYIIRSNMLDDFMWRASYFVFLGFVWSILALCRTAREAEIAKKWALIDGGQVLFTLAVLLSPKLFTLSDNTRAIVLTIGYLICLFLDFRYMLRWRSG